MIAWLLIMTVCIFADGPSAPDEPERSHGTNGISESRN